QAGITYNDVKLSITIKPQINKNSNFVKLDINAQLQDVSERELPAQVQAQAQAITERKAKTSIVVADSDTVGRRGLIRDRQSRSVSKIPVLGDIPILGWLFRSASSVSEKTNLFMFITPQIIRKYEKVRALLDQKLKERDDFLEKNAGGQDPHRDYRN